MKLAVLTTPGIHHTYFLHRLIDVGLEIDALFYETSFLQSPFDTSSRFDKKQNEFEQDAFSCYPLKDPVIDNVFHYPSLNQSDAVSQLRCVNADIGVVFGCGKLCEPVIQSIPMLINIHKGFAEEYRGLDSDLWPIYHGDYNKIGVSIHKVDKALDTGDIAAAEKVRLKKCMKIEELRYAWVVVATKLIIDCLNKFKVGKLFFTPQSSMGRYYSFMPSELKNICADRFDKYCSKL